MAKKRTKTKAKAATKTKTKAKAKTKAKSAPAPAAKATKVGDNTDVTRKELRPLKRRVDAIEADNRLTRERLAKLETVAGIGGADASADIEPSGPPVVNEP